MKPILLLFVLLTLGFAGNAATVSGSLTNLSTSAGIPYYWVYLTDSSGSAMLYQDSTVTNASGNFSFNIPSFLTSGTIIVSAQTCGSRITNRSAYSGSSLTLNLSGCSSSTATINGYLVSWVGGSVQSHLYNRKVYIVDSTATHYHVDSVLTEYDGHYSYSVPPGFASGTLRVYALSTFPNPSSVYVQYRGATVNNVNLNVYIKKRTMYGKTTLGGAPNNGPTKLYLILKAYDPVLMDTTLTAIDSFNTIGTTGCFNREYDSTASSVTNSGMNSLLVKAVLLPTHSSYASYIPAYSYNSLNWNTAKRIDSTDPVFHYDSNYFPADVDLPAGVNPGGPGFIGGSVLLGANKSTAVGDPLSSRTLILTTASGQAVGITKSNASGQFNFPALAYGNYLIFGDAWGKDNPPLAVTLSASNKTVSNIIFEENNKSFKGHFKELAVNNNAPVSLVKLYPNPAQDYILLNGLNAINGDKTAIISDLTGAVHARTILRAGSNPTISTANLPAGIYLLQLQTESGVMNLKFVKE